jgi:nucleoid-associated protein YgaU
MRSWKSLLILVAAGIVAVGCGGKKRVEGAEVPAQPQTVEQAKAKPTVTPKAAASLKYIVVKGDTLWGISSKGSIYGDPFQWPMIFKSNRDQIQDPDLIYPKQSLGIRQDASSDEKTKAHKAASNTPKYVPHTKPRETLPVDYF